MSKRREYSPEFKREAVDLTRTKGVTIAQIARELGIGANMLNRWHRELAANGTKAFRVRARPVTKRWQCSSGNWRG